MYQRIWWRTNINDTGNLQLVLRKNSMTFSWWKKSRDKSRELEIDRDWSISVSSSGRTHENVLNNRLLYDVQIRFPEKKSNVWEMIIKMTAMDCKKTFDSIEQTVMPRSVRNHSLSEQKTCLQIRLYTTTQRVIVLIDVKNMILNTLTEPTKMALWEVSSPSRFSDQ